MNKESWIPAITLPIYAVFFIAELIVSGKQRQHRYHFKETSISIWSTILGGFFDAIALFICFLALDFFNDHAIFQTSLQIYYPLIGWTIVFITQDLFFYWLHRSMHNIRLLWAAHSNHHSSAHFNFSIALKSFVFQPFYRFVFYISIAFLGFEGTTIKLVYAINQVYQFFLHTEYGGMMQNWKKIFGPFRLKLKTETPIYGLTQNIKNFHPLKSLIKEFERIILDIIISKKISEKTSYPYNKPYWKPASI